MNAEMTLPVHQACLLLGSNIQPGKNIALAIKLLRQSVTVMRSSSVWETQAVGSVGPDFLNLALLITTALEAGELKEKVLRPLETQLGRVRSADKNAPRPIDLDIIIFDDQLLDPNLWIYAHRAVPVAEILPDYRSAHGDTLQEIASELAKSTPLRLKPDVLVGR
jgi:2-amino-4-hydroxy-6-hydroxymethyldihydropteridine diphosphokinase